MALGSVLLCFSTRYKNRLSKTNQRKSKALQNPSHCRKSLESKPHHPLSRTSSLRNAITPPKEKESLSTSNIYHPTKVEPVDCLQTSTPPTQTGDLITRVLPSSSSTSSTSTHLESLGFRSPELDQECPSSHQTISPLSSTIDHPTLHHQELTPDHHLNLNLNPNQPTLSDSLTLDPRPQSKRRSFWGRLSRTSSASNLTPTPSPTNNKMSLPLQEPIPETINSSTPTSNVQEMDSPRSAEIASAQSILEGRSRPNKPSQTQEPHLNPSTSGLAGIGVRDRSSIHLHAPGGQTSASQSQHRLSRPISKYSPGTSSPLSSQLASHPSSSSSPSSSSNSIHEHHISRPQHPLARSRLSYQPPSRLPPPPRPHLSSARLSFIPDNSAISSDDLMKLLRGPSAYPDEARPRHSGSYSVPNSRPASREGR